MRAAARRAARIAAPAGASRPVDLGGPVARSWHRRRGCLPLLVALGGCAGAAKEPTKPAALPVASRALPGGALATLREPRPDAPIAATWSVRDPDRGAVTVETATALDGVRWWLEHRLEVGAGRGALTAWIGIENVGDAPIAFADVEVAEGALATGPLALAPGEVAIVPAAAARGAARTVRLFDPVGDGATRAGARPVLDRRHGLGDADGLEQPLLLAVELGPELVEAAASWPRAPAAVFARDGAPRPLGRTTLGGGGQGASVAIGAAPELVGRRRRTELSIDRARHRAVEELRIELENLGPRAEEVLVREHLHRGLNWTIAYDNGAGRIEKIAPQVVVVRIVVPPGARREIVYRVVYTW